MYYSAYQNDGPGVEYDPFGEAGGIEAEILQITVRRLIGELYDETTPDKLEAMIPPDVPVPVFVVRKLRAKLLEKIREEAKKAGPE